MLPPSGIAATARLNILLIEDDQAARQCICDFLEMDGHHTTGTDNPQQALSLLRKDGDFHVVILDLLLPQIHGLELLREIRQINAEVSVIILTGYPSVDSASESILHDISAYLRKPFSMPEVRDALARIAKKKGLATSPEEALHQTIGRNLRELRQRRGLTLRQLAGQINLSVSALSQIERAESSSSISTLLRLATALGVKITDLLGDF